MNSNAQRQDHASPDCFKLTALTHVPKLSQGFQNSGNTIIQGENLAVLKMLLPRYDSAVRCCYIDPPYNNQERHYHYHDSREHQTWLEEIEARIELLAEFLRDDGSLWISIDDREVHYLKVACDKIMGRRNFVTTVVWQQRTTRENRKVFSNNHEYILVYARDIKRFTATRNSLALNAEVKSRYKNPDNDSRGPWQSVSANVQAGHATPEQFYNLVSPSGKVHFPPHGRCWVYSLAKMEREMRASNIWFGPHGDGVPRIKKFLSQAKAGLTPETLWTAKDVGTNDFAKKHLRKMFPDQGVINLSESENIVQSTKDVFDTPKPETLIQRILEIATSPGDLVLDAYLGSGTTAAVAHKCKRKYIGIEDGDHAVTYSAKRLSLVVDGDPSGISEAVGWQGGGGFDFFKLQKQRSFPC